MVEAKRTEDGVTKEKDRARVHGTSGRSTDATWPDDGPTEAVRLVLEVARLGELDLCGWWHAHALSKTGRYVLQRSFPRTWRSVALELDLASAVRRHDEALGGRRTALHLFSGRLPFLRLARAWLAEQKTREPNALFEAVAVLGRDEAYEHLAAITDEAPQGEVLGTGLKVGEVAAGDLDDPSSAWQVGRLLAASYARIDDEFLAPYVDVAS